MFRDSYIISCAKELLFLCLCDEFLATRSSMMWSLALEVEVFARQLDEAKGDVRLQ